MAVKLTYGIFIHWSELDSPLIVEVPKQSGDKGCDITYKEAIIKGKAVLENRIESEKKPGRPKPKEKLTAI